MLRCDRTARAVYLLRLEPRFLDDLGCEHTIFFNEACKFIRRARDRFESALDQMTLAEIRLGHDARDFGLQL